MAGSLRATRTSRTVPAKGHLPQGHPYDAATIAECKAQVEELRRLFREKPLAVLLAEMTPEERHDHEEMCRSLRIPGMTNKDLTKLWDDMKRERYAR